MRNYLNQRTGAVTLSVASNTVLILLKLAVGAYTGSVSIISEAIHSSTDLLAALIAFFAIRTAARPADANHPYGHGKAESLAAAVEALLIFLAAGLIVFEAARRLYYGEWQIVNLEWGIGVMAFSSAANFLVSRHLFRVARRTGSPALAADAWHLSTDLLTALGVGVGLILVRLTGIQQFDPLIAIGVALFIVKAAWDITRGSISDLLDESLPPSEEAKVRAILDAHRHLFSTVRALRTRRAGGRRHVFVELEFPPSVSLSDARAVTEHLRHEILQLYPAASVIVEAGAPARPLNSPERVTETVQRVARRLDAAVHHISTHQTGNTFSVSLHLEVDPGLSLEQAHALATRLEVELRQEISGLARVDTHIEPAGAELPPDEQRARDRARVEAALRALSDQVPQASGAHDVEVHRTADKIIVSLHVPLAGGVPIAEAHRIGGEIEARLRSALPDIQSVFVHTEPPE